MAGWRRCAASSTALEGGSCSASPMPAEFRDRGGGGGGRGGGGDAVLQEVANAIRKLEPPAWIEQTRVAVTGTMAVLILETTQQADGPYTFDGRPYLRIGNTTSRMRQAEYQRRPSGPVASTRHRWENQAAEGYSTTDLDLEEVDRFRCGPLLFIAGTRKPVFRSACAFERLQLRVDGQLLNGAVVLFHGLQARARLSAMHRAAGSIQRDR